MSLAAAGPEPTTYAAVPLEGLAAATPLSFPLYLRTAPSAWVLYRDAAMRLSVDQIGRLAAEGVTELFIRTQDKRAYSRRVERGLGEILRNRAVPIDRRADVLYGVATEVVDDLLEALPSPERIHRARAVMLATSGLLLRDQQGFEAIRRVLAAGPGMTRHSLTVGFLAMGLTRQVLGAEPNLLMLAGLAGLLHDVGRIGHAGHGHDPEHAQRGHDYLRRLSLPGPVCEAALYHHERFDGSGYPRGKAGHEIPELARVVGLVNTFDKVYAGQQPRVSVFDALRILAQAYRGCFDEVLARGLVRLFAA